MKTSFQSHNLRPYNLPCLESDSEAISVPGKKYYKVNSLYVLVIDTPVSVHNDDRMDSCNGDDVDWLALDSDSEVISVPGKK